MVREKAVTDQVGALLLIAKSPHGVAFGVVESGTPEGCIAVVDAMGDAIWAFYRKAFGG